MTSPLKLYRKVIDSEIFREEILCDDENSHEINLLRYASREHGEQSIAGLNIKRPLHCTHEHTPTLRDFFSTPQQLSRISCFYTHLQ